jgi:hypothetical protein
MEWNGRNTIRDQIKNSVIPNGLNIYNLNDKIKKVVSTWNHHIVRMKPEPIPKQLICSILVDGSSMDPRSYASSISLCSGATDETETSEPRHW